MENLDRREWRSLRPPVHMSHKIKKISILLICSILLVCAAIYGIWIFLVTHYVDGGKGFEIESYSINKELDNLPPIENWKEFVDDDFKISFKYPPEKWVVKLSDHSPISVVWKIFAGTQINIYRKPKQNDDNFIKIITETDKANYEGLQISRLRKDFVEITDITRSKTADGIKKYILIQKDYIVEIQLMNYGRWTGNQKNLKFIYAIDRGLDLVARTIRTIE